MLIEVGFMSKKEVKWKRESGSVEGSRVWVAFIGPEQREDVEAGRWFGGRRRWTLQWIGYRSGGEPGGGEIEGWAIATRGRRGGGELVSTMTGTWMADRQATTATLEVGEESS
jgi:hypothetical protein